jgi:prepilin-type N-terminal cleavage/methylation domain-containing protein
VNTDRARSRGFTLIEVFAALGILGVSLLGLTAGVLVAFGGNGRSSRRTQMAEFAQARLERFSAASKANICTASTTGSVVDCSKMSPSPTPFDPTAAPNSGGWMLDVLDRASSGASTVGVDQMAGPLLVLGDTGGAVDEVATVTGRNALLSEWGTGSGSGNGCASTLVGKNMLCREVHIELDSTLTFYHIWVRVIRGQNYLDGPVVFEGMVAK